MRMVRSVRLGVGVALVWAVLVSLLGAGSASAALPSSCVEAQTLVTCTFSTVGTQDAFVVPVGVTSVSVVAVGAAGTTNSNNYAVGAGAQVSANLSVTPLAPGVQ
jgi:hypothetical protein